MSKSIRVASVVVVATLAALVGAGAHADDAQKAFEANKCSNCHSIDKLKIERKIESEKMAGPDLSTVGDKHDAAWIVKFVSRETEQDGKQHKSEHKGPKADLQAIADWLASMKASG